MIYIDPISGSHSVLPSSRSSYSLSTKGYRNATEKASYLLLALTYIIRAFAIVLLAAGAVMGAEFDNYAEINILSMPNAVRDTIAWGVFIGSAATAFCVFFVGQWAAVHAHAAQEFAAGKP